MQRLNGQRLRKKAPLQKGEKCVLRIEIYRSWAGGWGAWLWAEVPGSGDVVYAGSASSIFTPSDPDLEPSQLLDELGELLQRLGAVIVL